MKINIEPSGVELLEDHPHTQLLNGTEMILSCLTAQESADAPECERPNRELINEDQGELQSQLDSAPLSDDITGEVTPFGPYSVPAEEKKDE